MYLHFFFVLKKIIAHKKKRFSSYKLISVLEEYNEKVGNNSNISSEVSQ